MTNYVWVFKMKATKWNAWKIAEILKQVPALNMPWCIKYNMAIHWDYICGYEEWKNKEAHTQSMQIPEVKALVSQAFPYMDWMPEMLFEWENII